MAAQLGRYTLMNRIGSGGMAEVFLARGPAGVCVIKRMHERIAEDPDLVRMFLDEASLAAQLNHPGIARVFDLGESGGQYFFAMEYVPGFDLYTVLQEHQARRRFVTPQVAARVAADIAAALHHAHEAVSARGQRLNIIHRDVSPQNILVSSFGQVKLIDFGVARASSKLHQTRAGLVKGKAAYMAPEQVVGGAIDRRVDIYALGLNLFELLTNRRAIKGEQEMEQILNARAAELHDVEEFRKDVPISLRAVMQKCLHPKPEGRYATADLVRADLEQWLANSGLTVQREDVMALLQLVPADPTHVFEPQARGGRPGDSTVRPSAPPGLKPRPTDETYRPARRTDVDRMVASLMDTDDGDAPPRTDVERHAALAQTLEASAPNLEPVSAPPPAPAPVPAPRPSAKNAGPVPPVRRPGTDPGQSGPTLQATPEFLANVRSSLEERPADRTLRQPPERATAPVRSAPLPGPRPRQAGGSSAVLVIAAAAVLGAGAAALWLLLFRS